MRTITHLILLLLFCPSLGTLLTARTLEAVRTDSRIAFHVRATMHGFEGSADDWTFSATLPEGADRPTAASVSIVVAAMNTGNDARDREMRHWLESDTHAAITFVLTGWKAVDGTEQAEGDLQIHGTTRRVSIPATFTTKDDAFTLSGELTLDHRDFDLKQIRKFGLLTVSPEVKVTFALAGKLR